DDRPQVIALLDRLDLGLVQRAADDQPHGAVVGDQPLDPPPRQGQGVSTEIAGRAVVSQSALERRDVEQRDQVAVLVAVAGFPGERRQGWRYCIAHGFVSTHRGSSAGLAITVPSSTTTIFSIVFIGHLVLT